MLKGGFHRNLFLYFFERKANYKILKIKTSLKKIDLLIINSIFLYYISIESMFVKSG